MIFPQPDRGILQHVKKVENTVSSLFILIPVAFIFVIVAIKLFFWSVKSGQYDDLDTEAKRILFDDDDDDQPTGNEGQRKDKK